MIILRGVEHWRRQERRYIAVYQISYGRRKISFGVFSFSFMQSKASTYIYTHLAETFLRPRNKRSLSSFIVINNTWYRFKDLRALAPEVSALECGIYIHIYIHIYTYMHTPSTMIYLFVYFLLFFVFELDGTVIKLVNICMFYNVFKWLVAFVFQPHLLYKLKLNHWDEGSGIFFMFNSISLKMFVLDFCVCFFCFFFIFLNFFWFCKSSFMQTQATSLPSSRIYYFCFV